MTDPNTENDLAFDPMVDIPDFHEFGTIPLETIRTVDAPVYSAAPDEVVFQVGHMQLVRLVRALQLSAGNTGATQYCRLSITPEQLKAVSFNHLSLSEYKIELVTAPQNLTVNQLDLIVACATLRNAAMGGQEFVTFVVRQAAHQMLVVSSGFERPIALEAPNKFIIPQTSSKPIWSAQNHRASTIRGVLSFVANFAEESENGRYIGYSNGTMSGQSRFSAAVARIFEQDNVSFNVNTAAAKSIIAALDLMSDEERISFGTWEQYLAIESSRFCFLVQKRDHGPVASTDFLQECEILVPAKTFKAALLQSGAITDEDASISLIIESDALKLNIQMYSENGRGEQTQTEFDGVLANGTLKAADPWILPFIPLKKAADYYTDVNFALSRVGTGSQVMYRVEVREDHSGDEGPAWQGHVYMGLPKPTRVVHRRR